MNSKEKLTKLLEKYREQEYEYFYVDPEAIHRYEATPISDEFAMLMWMIIEKQVESLEQCENQVEGYKHDIDQDLEFQERQEEELQSLNEENQKLFKESLVFQQFIEWYSGMDSDKIAKAFIRFKKEELNEQ